MIEKIIKEEAGKLETPNTFLLGNRSSFESEGDDVALMPVVYMSEDVHSSLVRNMSGTISSEYQVAVLILDQADHDNENVEDHLPIIEAMETLGIELFGRLNNRSEFRQEGLTDWQMDRIYHIFNQDLVGVFCTFNARIMDAGVAKC